MYSLYQKDTVSFTLNLKALAVSAVVLCATFAFATLAHAQEDCCDDGGYQQTGGSIDDGGGLGLNYPEMEVEGGNCCDTPEDVGPQEEGCDLYCNEGLGNEDDLGNGEDCPCDLTDANEDGIPDYEETIDEFGNPSYGGGGSIPHANFGSSFAPHYSYTTPHYSTYYPTKPIVIAPPHANTPQSSTNITNNNTNVNNNVNNNSATAVVYNVAQSQPQYPVQYTYPAQSSYYQPTYQHPYCTITISNYNGYNAYGPYAYNQLATLSWTSSYATTAFINQIGSVALSGSQAVYPTNGMVYTMTVSGPGGTATCQTNQYYMPVYTPPVTYTNPTVSLTQIPYTGFDFGTFGNAIYWMSLIAFAASAAYLALYFIPGNLGRGFALATVKSVRMPAPLKAITIPAAAAIVRKATPALTPSPIQPKDTMSVVKSDSAGPRISIDRAFS